MTVYYCVHKSLPLIPVLSQMHPVQLSFVSMKQIKRNSSQDITSDVYYVQCNQLGVWLKWHAEIVMFVHMMCSFVLWQTGVRPIEGVLSKNSLHWGKMCCVPLTYHCIDVPKILLSILFLLSFSWMWQVFKRQYCWNIWH